MGTEPHGHPASISRERAIADLVFARLKPFLEEMGQKLDMAHAKLDAILVLQRQIEAEIERTRPETASHEKSPNPSA